jgi:hypothetical protein
MLTCIGAGSFGPTDYHLLPHGKPVACTCPVPSHNSLCCTTPPIQRSQPRQIWNAPRLVLTVRYTSAPVIMNRWYSPVSPSGEKSCVRTGLSQTTQAMYV